MSLLWCDGFDHYGVGTAGRDAMLDGPYAEISTAGDMILPQADFPRTGARSLKMTASVSDPLIRRVFGGDKSVAGVGYAFVINQLPSIAATTALASFRDNGNVQQVTIGLTTTGQIEARTGAVNGTVIGTSAPVIVAGAYQHFECRVGIGTSAGTVEVRIDGVTVLDIAAVNTRGAGAAQTAQVAIITGADTPGGNGVGTMWVDDMFAWDDQGSAANDFLGDQQVHLLLPDQDTAQSDWTRNTGSTDYEQIAESTPDDDTTHIAASVAGDISEFGLDDLPANAASIAAVQVIGRLRKTDAGTANVQMSLVSDGESPTAPAEANGADRPVTQVYTYWQDVFHTDPATAAPWTPEALNDARLKIERTA
jgi:hypothetical protein